LNFTENRALRIMCEPKGDEVTEGLRNLQDKELHQMLLGPSNE
jgi:hypothetical protein